MNIGDTNKNNIKLLQKTGVKSTSHNFATIWKMECSEGHVFGSNSCDAHGRKCCTCDSSAAPGEPLVIP